MCLIFPVILIVIVTVILQSKEIESRNCWYALWLWLWLRQWQKITYKISPLKSKHSIAYCVSKRPPKLYNEAKRRNKANAVAFDTQRVTDYGHQERAFFKILELLGLGRHFRLIFWGTIGLFSAGLSAPILVLWAPCLCFILFNHYFYKKG